MKKITIFLALVFTLIFIKANDNTNVNAKVYDYWNGYSIQKSYSTNPVPGVNYSGFYCSLNDNKLKTFNQVQNSSCKERGVIEFVHNKTHKIWVGFQHGKQDMFFDNKKEALEYVFRRIANFAHFARNVKNQLVYFNAYGLQYGSKGNQRHQVYGPRRYGYVKAPNGKMMFQNNDYFVVNAFRNVSNKARYFGYDGTIVKNRIVVSGKYKYYVDKNANKVVSKKYVKTDSTHGMYNFNHNGILCTSKSNHFDGSRYINTTGRYLRNEIKIIDNIKYKFDDNGISHRIN